MAVLATSSWSSLWPSADGGWVAFGGEHFGGAISVWHWMRRLALQSVGLCGMMQYWWVQVRPMLGCRSDIVNFLSANDGE